MTIDGANPLFLEFRAAAGPRRRFLLNRLLQENYPLVKLLVSQLTGLTESGGVGCLKRRGYRVPGSDVLQWDDAYQVGLVGMAKAIEQFDPDKGRIAGYAKNKIYYELQKVVESEHMIHAPGRKKGERPFVDLVDDRIPEQEGSRALDRLASVAPDVFDLPEGITAADLAKWRRTGKWPEWEQFRPPPPERTVVEEFLSDRLVFRRVARVACRTLTGAFTSAVEARRVVEYPADLFDALTARGLRRITARMECWGGPVSAWAGTELRNMASI